MKSTPGRHRFEYRRPDGTGEALELETAESLFHDLLCFAVESEAGLRGSFYGLLAKVGGYAELRVAGGQALGGEIAVTERAVGALAEALKVGDLEAAAFVEQATEALALYDERPPRWFTPAFALRIRGRMAELESRWDATPVGGTMTLSFPLPR